MKVGEVVGMETIQVEANVPLREAARLMTEENVGCLIVLERRSLVGILTERDVVFAVSEGNESSGEVWEYMTTAPVTALPEASFAEVATLMIEEHIRHLPVVSASSDFWGVISIRDVLAVLSGDEPQRELTFVGDALDIDPDEVADSL